MEIDRRRLGRIAAGVGGAGVVLAAAGAIAFHAWVDPERLVAQARDKAKSAWDRELSVGELRLQVFPRPAVRAERIALSNPPWAEEKDFLAADQVTAAFELLPLLSGHLEVKSLDVRGATIDIEEGDGRTTIPERRDKPPTAPQPAHVPFPSLHYLRLEDVRVNIRRAAAPPVAWTIPTARIETDGELRGVEFEGTLARDGHAFELEGKLRDASRLGQEGATSVGFVRARSPEASLDVEGTIPLQKALKGHAVTLRAKGRSMAPLLAFAGIARQPGAPFELAAHSRELDGRILLSNLRLQLGAQAASGELAIARNGERKRIEGRLASDRIDWAQAFVDSGGTVVPDPPTDKLYSDRPMAWGFLEALEGKEGTVELALRSLKLRNGIELRNATATATFRDGELALKPFAAELLGGKARGAFAFAAAGKKVRIDLEAEGVAFERWLRERGSKLRFTGGPMRVKAAIAGAGESMQDVAGSITGPITLSMGAGRFHSEHAGEVERLMTDAFAAQGASDIRLECAAAALDFRNGRATGKKIVGFRTEASRLVTSGTVDFREGKVELRGKIAAKKGVTLGLSSLADDIVIAGPVRAPKFALDKTNATGTALARVGAAIATAGVSLIGGAIAEAASKKGDPCEEVLDRRKGSDPNKQKGSDPN